MKTEFNQTKILNQNRNMKFSPLEKFCYLQRRIVIKSPLEKIRSLQRRIELKSPLEKLILVREIITYFFNKIFCPVTDPNYEFRWYNLFFVFIYVINGIAIFHTIYRYQDDIFTCIRGVYLIVSMVPVR